MQKEAANIRNQFLMEGHKAREVRIGMLLAMSDLVMVAKRITEGEEDDSEAIHTGDRPTGPCHQDRG